METWKNMRRHMRVVGNAANGVWYTRIKANLIVCWWGYLGRSYAFEIAERVGVHRTIVQKAKSKLGKEVVHSEQFIGDLEKKNVELAKLLTSNSRQADDLAKLKEKYELMRLELKNNKQKILNDAKLEAKKLIEKANQKSRTNDSGNQGK